MKTLIRKDGNREVMDVAEAKIMRRPFSDFSGVNSNGNHHFNIEIPEECVEAFKSFGFKPYYLDGKDGKYEPKWILDIVIGYKFGDPGVVVVSYNGTQTPLKENTIGDLDDPNINIDYVDMTLSRHAWERNGQNGIKPYGSKLFFYLGQPSFAEQRYQERFGAVAQGVLEPVQPELPFDPDENDIPF